MVFKLTRLHYIISLVALPVPLNRFTKAWISNGSNDKQQIEIDNL